MHEYIITVDNKEDADLIRKIIAKFSTASIKVRNKRKTELEQALADIETGKVTHCEDFDDFLKKING